MFLQLQEAKEHLLPPLATGVTRVNAPSSSYRNRNLMTICVWRRADNYGNSAGYGCAQPRIYWPYTIMSQNPKAQEYCKKLTEKKKGKRGGGEIDLYRPRNPGKVHAPCIVVLLADRIVCAVERPRSRRGGGQGCAPGLSFLLTLTVFSCPHR